MTRVNPLTRLGTLLAALLILLATACSPQQTQTLTMVNDARSANGVHILLPSPHAMDKAQRWAESLASRHVLEHSDLRDGMPEGFRMLGENVGRGPSIEAIQQAFLDSPHHQANILDSRFDWGGTGYAVARDGTVYVVQVFAKY